MITEDYVSFELAKLLKEKGFDEDIDLWYDENGDIFFQHKYNINNNWRVRQGLKIYQRPTLQMVMKWLREVHTIDIVITPSMFRKKYNVCIYKDENLCCVDFDGATLSPSYEYACEAAIKYCLEKLI